MSDTLLAHLPPWSAAWLEALAMLGAASYALGKRLGFLPSLAFFFFSFSALRMFAAPEVPMGDLPLALIRPGDFLLPFQSLLAQLLSASAAGAAAVAALTLLAAWTPSLASFLSFWRALARANGALCLYLTFFGSRVYGILYEGSMSGCFAVALLPCFFTGDEPKTPWEHVKFGLSLGLAAAPALLTRQSLPLGCLLAFFAICALRLLSWKRATLFIGASAALLAGFGLLASRDAFFSSSGRFTMWPIFMQWWAANVDPWLGSGSGSFAVIGPRLSRLAPVDMGYYVFIHSDWLQVLFEQGLVGLGILLSLYAWLLERSWRRFPCFLALALYGIFALANMPLHYPLSALYGAFLLRWTLSEKA